MRAIFALTLWAVPVCSAASEPLMPVPVVGCKSDGQVGPLPAPKGRKGPSLPRKLAIELAYYTSEDGPAVLAPRGWHCFGLYGSNGSILIVTPKRHNGEEFLSDKPFETTGPAVESRFSYGGTSGRFAVWEAIARYFPSARKFIDTAEYGELTGEPLPRGPYLSDVIRSRTPRSIQLETPAGTNGEGTSGRLAPGDRPVEAILMLMGGPEETSLLEINVRLPVNQKNLAETILANPGGNQ